MPALKPKPMQDYACTNCFGIVNAIPIWAKGDYPCPHCNQHATWTPKP